MVNAWGKDLEDRRAHVLHLGGALVGRVKKFYDGDKEKKGDCYAPVLELEEGHSFIATPEHFVELDRTALSFYEGLMIGTRALVEMAARGAPSLGMEKGLALTIAVFRTQLRQLQVEDPNG